MPRHCVSKATQSETQLLPAHPHNIDTAQKFYGIVSNLRDTVSTQAEAFRGMEEAKETQS
jgi:hypothetical protein